MKQRCFRHMSCVIYLWLSFIFYILALFFYSDLSHFIYFILFLSLSTSTGCIASLLSLRRTARKRPPSNPCGISYLAKSYPKQFSSPCVIPPSCPCILLSSCLVPSHTGIAKRTKRTRPTIKPTNQEVGRQSLAAKRPNPTRRRRRDQSLH